MAKKASTFKNMTLTLLVITVVAGISLGYINEVTKGPIAQAKLKRTTDALKNVLPEFDNDPVQDVFKVSADIVRDSVEIYSAFREGTRVGWAVVSSSEKGYNGLIKLMVGFDTNGNIIDIRVLEQKETPGLGTKIKGEKFKRQFRGKNPSNFDLKVKKDQGEVDALTGATITTRAFSEAVQLAYDKMIQNQSKNESDE